MVPVRIRCSSLSPAGLQKKKEMDLENKKLEFSTMSGTMSGIILNSTQERGCCTQLNSNQSGGVLEDVFNYHEQQINRQVKGNTYMWVTVQCKTKL